MAPRQAERNNRKVGRQRSMSQAERTRPQGIRKERLIQPSSRKSERLQERTVSKDTNAEPKYPRSFPTGNTSGKDSPQKLSAPLKDKDRKRKRAQESEESPIRKRPRTSVTSLASGDTLGQSVDGKVNPINYWVEKEQWPKEYFEPDDQTTRDFEKDSWFEKYWEPENNMNHLLARKRSSSVRGKQSEASSGSSNQKPREVKSAPYQDARYETLLATNGSFMGRSELGATATSKSFCRTLLETEQTFPNGSMFHDELFEEACEMVRNKNEARVVRDISLLIVPSAEILAIRGAKHLKILIESVNEGWNNSIPITKTRPQPDYSVAFRREAFTEDQLKRIGPFVGELIETSFFMATYFMYFPFFTCEVKCGAAALDIADRQNAHSMTMAVRGIVELFRLVKREKELHREILAFSISHDHRSVRIYGHYPVINGKDTTYYRHPIHDFSFTALDGKEKWTAYQFTANVYDLWAPNHLKRICSVIDTLPPNINFEVSQQSDLGESGLSQGLESYNFSDLSSQDTESLLEEGQSSGANSRDVTPNTSLSNQTEMRQPKKSRKRGPPIELHQDGKID